MEDNPVTDTDEQYSRYLAAADPDVPYVACKCGFYANLPGAKASDLRAVYAEHTLGGCPLMPPSPPGPPLSSWQIFLHGLFSVPGLIMVVLALAAIVAVVASLNGVNPFTWQKM